MRRYYSLTRPVAIARRMNPPPMQVEAAALLLLVGGTQPPSSAAARKSNIAEARIVGMHVQRAAQLPV